MLRLFVGFFPPLSIVDEFNKQIEKSAHLFHFRWTKPESLHITVKFLGAVSAEKVLTINSVLADVANNTHPFQIQMAGGGVFPRLKAARVFWAGLAGDLDRLNAVATQLETQLDSVGFPMENRKFKPHITVAKPLKERCPEEECVRFCKLLENFHSAMFDFNALQLVKSELGPSGSRYTVLETFPLKAIA